MHYQVNNFNICSKDEVYKGYTKDYEHLPKTMLSCNVLANCRCLINVPLFLIAQVKKKNHSCGLLLHRKTNILH